MIGTAAPVTSIIRLSTPTPAAADSTCSTVLIEASPSVNWVAKEVACRFSSETGISLPSRSRRRNRMPLSTGAGSNRSCTRRPQCNPTPVQLTSRRMVFCVRVIDALGDALGLIPGGYYSKRRAKWTVVFVRCCKQISYGSRTGIDASPLWGLCIRSDPEVWYFCNTCRISLKG